MRKISVFMVIAMIFCSMNIMSVSADNNNDVIAGWTFSSSTTIPSFATEGSDSGAWLDTDANGKDTVNYTTNNGSIYITGWGAGKYWEFNLDTTGYEGIKFSTKTQSSGSGPKNWKLTYSIDGGTTWEDIAKSNIENENSLVQKYNGFELPVEIANRTNVKIRLVIIDDESVSGATISSTGTSRLANVSFQGTAAGAEGTGSDDGSGSGGGDGEGSGTGTNVTDPITADMVPEGTLTIDEVNNGASGSVTVIGQVVYGFGNATSKNTYILQDVIDGEVAALQIYDYTNSYNIGDIVTVTGTVGAYGGVTQIGSVTNVTKLEYEVSKFPATEVTLAELMANSSKYISQYVVVKGVTLGSQGTNGTASVTDGTNTIAIFTGALYPDGITAGSEVDLYAVFSKYNTTLQFRVGSSSDYVDGSLEVDTSIEYPLANWAGTAAPTAATVYGDLNAANDGLDTDAELTHSTGNIPAVNNSNIGYTGMQSDDYYELKVSSALLGNITLSYAMKGSNTGPKEFRIYYSTDGTNYELASETVYKISAASKWENYEIVLPSAANNAEALYIRIQVASTTSINGNTIGTGGTNYLQEISVKGNPVISDSIARIPEVTPGSGDIKAGQELTMSSETSGATIWYAINDEAFTQYDASSKPVLDTLPAAVTVYAEKEGLTSSLQYTYEYTQTKIGSVKASPNGGAVVQGTKVTLSTATEGAVILYSFDNGQTWQQYNSSDKIALNELPATVRVKATMDGCLDSTTTTLSYTERENETYNIYFGQLHSHTDYSDGSGSIDDAYSHASEADQIDYLAVTDHSNWFDNNTSASIKDGSVSANWVEGQQKAEEYTSDTFVALFGYEMTWSNGLGHINTFNTDGFQSRTQSDYSAYSTALQNYYSALKTDTDSLSQFNHPGTTFGDFNDFGHYDEETDDLIPLIEVGNGEGAVGSSGYFPSYQYYTRALDKGWHVAPTNNQDNHKGNWGDANTARTVVLADSLTTENVYDAIRNMRMYATEDNDLEIYYTLDGYVMGTALDEDAVGDTVDLVVDLNDPTDSAIGKVQVIVNGGMVAAEQTVNTNSETVAFTIEPNYSYYYIQVTQADGDIAVTAPVWIGDVEAAGISSISTSTALQVVGEEIDINLELYNNESSDMEIQEVYFTINDEVIHEVDLAAAGLTSVASYDSQAYSFDYTHQSAGSTNIYVTVKATLGGVGKVYSDVLKLNYMVPEMVTKIVVDGTHYNDYVTGYYGGNMGEFSKLASTKNAQVNIVTDEITEEILEDCGLLIISAPAKKTGTANAGSYTTSHFEDSFIDLVVDYANKGGTVILCGLADYQDTTDCQSSTEINKLLVALGAATRLNSDETWDDDNNGGQQYRLYLTNHNSDSIFTEGVSDTQKFSAYSGCTVVLDEAAVSEGTAEYLVKGHETTYSIDSRNYDSNYVEIEKGEAVVLSRETLSSGANVFVSGTVFMSDYEITAVLDNVWDEPYSNQTIMENILDTVAVELETTTIAEARTGELGDVYAVEGWVTAGTSVPGNTFFDTIYIQDETGGITIFPYAVEGLKIGTKVRIVGYLDEYQGDLELQVMQSTVLDSENLNEIDPREVSASDAMDYTKNGGSLLKVSGEVTEVTMNGSIVSQFRVKDENGDVATIFIDGYIYSAKTGTNELASFIEVGAQVEAVGLLYLHPEGNSVDSVPCLRVRNCDEIKLLEEDVNGGAEDGQPVYADSSNNKIKGSGISGSGTEEDPYVVTAGVEFTLTASGDRQDADGNVIGDTRFVPHSWNVNPSGVFPEGGPYTITTQITKAGTYTLTVVYNEEVWNGSKWEANGNIDTITADIKVLSSDGTDGDTDDGTDSGTDGNTDSGTGGNNNNNTGSGSSGTGSTSGSVSTGDNTAMALYVILMLIGAAMAGGFVYKRKRER